MALRRIENRGDASQWECLCDCGRMCTRTGSALTGGKVRSCGCLRAEINALSLAKSNTKHGRTRTAEYRAWTSMKKRCTDSRSPSWPDYGGRGITVCERWAHSFVAFLVDVGERPSPLHSIDRIDNDGNYEPGNVRWATREQQARNKRVSRLDPVSVCLIRHMDRRGEHRRALAHAFGVSETTIGDVISGRTWVAP